ncbi:ATP-dependent RNA helicase SUPV3L1, mitochondrial isoform X1 [Meriones unguiculatus]|uniref:ATP-dependent RNA helicase SUPV3L1, mitochondrial isoform X1 n=2 Tax=Meriones unguiculatus TaxID=10047 RepID=UPI00293E94D8|nr:ATP-dependent RNA helicase SUPV3L1, mitochondrial isoform X1 [Meriones unguiculatus]
MSLPRCALLWARLPAGRGAGPQTAASSALRALVGPFPRALGRAPCLAASSSASGGSKAPNTSLFVPLTVKPLGPSADGDVGAELTRPLDKNEVKKILDRFYKRQEIQKLSADSGLDARLFHQAFISFRNYIMQSHSLDVDIHIVLNDICFSAAHVDDLFPFFLRHAKQIFPVLECKDDLRKISDLRIPPNWYPEARAIQRKIIFHSGPTNSGKTYHAIQRYLSAKSGVYCGPLKLLAHEIFEKSNAADVPCELVTGEERLTVAPEGKEATHVSCTVEMCSVTTPYEVAVIDEIQMIRDPARGWAWTRALLGLCAEEVHLCGEPAAIDLVSELLYTTGEEVEVQKYKRLTPITVLNHALESLDNLRPGDCIVCFSKNDIYSVSRQIEIRGMESAVIYGSLPPGTKLAQARKFNDPSDPCKILVATDAIGMGLNLSIRRIIFYSLIKPSINEKGEKELEPITTSQALQIAGRAGRFSSQFKEGEVTTMYQKDLALLKEILNRPVDPIQAAGLHPTAEQIEMFAYHLPETTLSNLIDIFVDFAQVDGQYFVCNMDDFKFSAELIQHIPLSLRVRYVFCTAPISKKQPLVCSSLLQFARQYSRNEPLTFAWLRRYIKWPLLPPKNIKDLMDLEAVHDVFDLYLWLSYRFLDMFPDSSLVRGLQKELDTIIQDGVHNITKLIKISESHKLLNLEGVLGEDQPRFSGTAKSPARRTRGTKSSGSKAEEPVSPSAKELPLASRLVQQGLLTADMLKQLQKEWQTQRTDHGKEKAGTRRKKTDHNSD